MNCHYCGKPYPMNRGNRRWCSVRCGVAWREENPEGLDADTVEPGTSRRRGFLPLDPGPCPCGAHGWLYREGMIDHGARIEKGVLCEPGAFHVGSLMKFCGKCMAKREAAR